jgi:S-adenosyl-L-methionine hydrolase (adenosine-forming)
VIVTLLTDFGTSDHFVAAMKGVILSRDAGIRVVDITHDIPRHGVEEAAFVLLNAWREFPTGTVHLAVVDPGVGSARRGIAIGAESHFFVGPDNGIFSHALEGVPAAEARELANRDLVRPRASSTFHGRDVFAPVAAALATGTPLQEVGPLVDELVSLESVRPSLENGALQGRILHVDRFGNCVTSFSREDVVGWGDEGFHLRVGAAEIRDLLPFYAAGTPGEPFLIWGSAGFLEISLDRDAADRALGLATGAPVSLHPG